MNPADPETQRTARVPAKARGAVLIEFALVFPILLVLTLTVVDVSRAFFVKNILYQAAREGARTAVVMTSADADVVEARVRQVAGAANVTVSSVTITGSGFTGTSAVKFGPKSADFTVGDDNTITATVPSGATTGKVSVTNIAGTTTSTAVYSVIVVPSITSFTPTTGAVGASVTIMGKGFTGVTGVSQWMSTS